MSALPWLALFALGLGCSAAVYGLHRTGRLAPPVRAGSRAGALTG